ncbi:MAG TPA: glycosyltransferase family 2 protein [Vicinamibacterales bacterium]|nr:glycosyltransferase family 2 protein [Vicinamibacterales bacterium]
MIHTTVWARDSSRDGNIDESPAPDLSILIPIFNEQENIPILLEQLFTVLRSLPYTFEVLAVDDGSQDASFSELQAAAGNYPELKVVRFRRNYGQTAAMMAGIDFSRGRILISLDADLQNDPADIPALLARLDEGYDVVSGWRKVRQDARFRRTFVSRVANRIISWISGVRLNDYGCTLKAYRREVIKDIKLYGEMHRFIPIYAYWSGARVTEIPVQHHARRRGQSKYGLERVVKVVLDMIVVKFLDRHFVKPIYVFGGVGLASIAIALLILSVTVWLRLAKGISMILTPLPLLSALFFLIGTVSVLMGLLAEMIVRTYFESQSRPVYAVRERVNL